MSSWKGDETSLVVRWRKKVSEVEARLGGLKPAAEWKGPLGGSLR
jgi:hypothetical protein